MVFEELRRQKRIVAELRAQVAAGRILSSVRRITSKVISKRQPYSLRDAEGQQVEDQSRWGDIVHEHFKEKFKSDDAVNPQNRRRIWRHRVRMAIQNGHSPGELSFEEFHAAMELMKPNVATGRDPCAGHDFALPSLRPPRAFCTMLWWKGSQCAKTLTSRTGLSSMLGPLHSKWHEACTGIFRHLFLA